MEKQKKAKAKSFYFIMLIFVVMVWGIAPNVSKYLLGVYSPAIKTAFTALIAFVAMLLVSAKKLKNLNANYFKVALPTGVFYSVACILQQVGLTKTTPTMYAFLENLSCLIVPFLVWIMTKERPTYFKFIASVLCLFSVYILGGGKLDGSFGIGDLLCGLAGIFYGVNIAVTGIKAKKFDLDAGLYLTIQFGVHLLISTAYAFLFEDVVFSTAPAHIALSIGITLVSTVLGWLLRTICLKHIDPSVVSVIMPFSSVITAIISVILGNDTLTVYLVVGAFLGLISAIIADFNPKRKEKEKGLIEPIEDVEGTPWQETKADDGFVSPIEDVESAPTQE